MVKKENTFEIYNNCVNNNFFHIWQNLVKTFNFIKIKKNDEENDIFDININTNIDTNNYFYDRYYDDLINTRKYGKYLDNKSKIIYNTDDCIIIIKNITNIFNNIYAVKDEYYQNRFFIGFEIDSTYLNSYINGIIIYFDENDKLYCVNNLHRNLFNFDLRNGNYNTYLYRQSLIFTQSHRDTRKLILGINLLDINDFILNSFNEYTDFNMTRYLSNNIQLNNINLNRFIIINGNYDEDTCTIFDMGSLKKNKTNNSNLNNYFINKNETTILSLNSYTVNKKDIKNFINGFTEELEYYGHGYPEKCILCNNNTCEASWTYKNIFMNLGKSYCNICKIRYSKTDNIWKCCKVNENHEDFCNQQINKTQCLCNHSNKMDIKVLGKSTKTSPLSITFS